MATKYQSVQRGRTVQPGKGPFKDATNNTAQVIAPYVAEQQPDGKWRIKDIPVFAEHNRDGLDFDVDWMTSAIKKHASRRKEGYQPPLHINHHAPGERVQAAGHFELTRVEQRMYEGKPTAVLLADLTDVPDQIYEEIEKGKLPYRSVEILDVSRPEIDSLALLDHEVPYFRFRNLKPDVVNRLPEEVHRFAGEPMLLYHKRGSGAGAIYTFNDEESKVAKQYKDDEEEMVEEEVTDEVPEEAVEEPVENEEQVDVDALLEEPAVAEPELTMDAAKGNLAAAFQGMAELMNSFQDELAQLRSMIVGEDGMPIAAAPLAEEAPVVEEEPMMVEEEAPLEDPAKDALIEGQGPMEEEEDPELAACDTCPACGNKKKEEVVMGGPVGFAAMKGRMRALEMKLRTYEARSAKKSKLDKAIDWAERRLKAYGLTDEMKTEIQEIARSEGSKGLKIYVSAVKRCGVPDPDQTWEAADVAADKTSGALATDPEAVRKYADQGPETLQLARAHAMAYQQGSDYIKRRYSLEKYIDSQLNGYARINGR